MKSAQPDRPQLLSPAGDWQCLKAAVANGADAVYFGLGDFNARRRATNFTLDELPAVMDYLHDRNVRGYVALNTLVFQDELETLARLAQAVARAGVDAAIVQDLGVLALLRRMCPQLAVHASTQMTQTSSAGIALLADMGVSRVILARELSLDELARLRNEVNVELEVFVHGALCVSYSGQCLASEAILARSANRGLCAQICRLPHSLMVDGKRVGDPACQYPLSPRDLSAWPLLPQLVAMGVSCFKIEGRLKGPHYVAAVTGFYRAALDAAIAGRRFEPDAARLAQLAGAYSRGFCTGWLEGGNHAGLVHGLYPDARGLELGKVVAVDGGSVTVELDDPDAAVSPGDGLLLACGEGQSGGRAYEVTTHPDRANQRVLAFDNALDLAAVRPGWRVYKTDDPAERRRIESTFARDVVCHRRTLDFTVGAVAGKPLTISATDDQARTAVAQSGRPLDRADKRPLTLVELRQQLDRLGQSPFALGQVSLIGPGGPADACDALVPASVINRLRRQVVEALAARARQDARREVADASAVAALLSRRLPPEAQPAAAIAGSRRLAVLVRHMAQLQAIAQLDAAERPALAWCDLPDTRDWPSAVGICRRSDITAGLVTPRVIHPGQETLLDELLAAGPDEVLVRNLSAAGVLIDHRRRSAGGLALVGDYSLNSANAISAHVLADLGLDRITAALDLDEAQLDAMLAAAPSVAFELLLQLQVPLMHSAYCPVGGATLCRACRSRADAKAPLPCRASSVRLHDRIGEEHPLAWDALSRCTIFHANVQADPTMPARLTVGVVGHFRVELVHQDGPQTARIARFYRRLLDGLASPGELARLCAGRITRGTWRQRDESVVDARSKGKA